jgi:hypothetical protein
MSALFAVIVIQTCVLAGCEFETLTIRSGSATLARQSWTHSSLNSRSRWSWDTPPLAVQSPSIDSNIVPSQCSGAWPLPFRPPWPHHHDQRRPSHPRRSTPSIPTPMPVELQSNEISPWLSGNRAYLRQRRTVSHVMPIARTMKMLDRSTRVILAALMSIGIATSWVVRTRHLEMQVWLVQSHNGPALILACFISYSS